MKRLKGIGSSRDSIVALGGNDRETCKGHNKHHVRNLTWTGDTVKRWKKYFDELLNLTNQSEASSLCLAEVAFLWRVSGCIHVGGDCRVDPEMEGLYRLYISSDLGMP